MLLYISFSLFDLSDTNCTTCKVHAFTITKTHCVHTHHMVRRQRDGDNSRAQGCCLCIILEAGTSICTLSCLMWLWAAFVGHSLTVSIELGHGDFPLFCDNWCGCQPSSACCNGQNAHMINCCSPLSATALQRLPRAEKRRRMSA